MGTKKLVGLIAIAAISLPLFAKDAYAGTIRTASRFTSGHSAGVDSDS